MAGGGGADGAGAEASAWRGGGYVREGCLRIVKEWLEGREPYYDMLDFRGIL